MNDLSIIIKADESGINNYIKVLEPLLLRFRPELILINNETDEFKMPFKNSVLKFSGDYNIFKEFCFSSSLGKKIIIIENGLRLQQEHISLIIQEINNNDYNNLSINLKTTMSEDKSLSSIWEEVFVYNRGVRGFNKNIGLVIEDLGLIDKGQDIEANIKKLLQGNHFNELFIWHENYILDMPMDFQSEFYSALEKNKRFIKKKCLVIIEELFLESKQKNKYHQYLIIRKVFRDMKDNMGSEEMQALQITENELYFCWLIKDFVAAQIAPHFMDRWQEDIRQSLLQYLFENDPESHLEFYNFIRAKSKDEKLIKGYLDYFQDQSEEPLRKEMLLEVFEVYLKLFKDQEFVERFNEAQTLLANKQLEASILLLKNLGSDYLDKNKIIRYYIQKIRAEAQCYPFVLSVCMIVKDEEKNLERCLVSLKPLIDSKIAELIIVDTGSRDKTIQIARQYTKNVLSFTWKDNFSEARNYANLFAEGEYIFTMDADEAFEKAEIDKISNEFRDENHRNYHTFLLRIKSYTNLEHTQYGVVTQPRIFKNNGRFYYSSSIHNQAMCDSKSKNLDIEVLHYGYIMTEDISERKFNRTATLLKKMLEKDPRNIYYRYQLSSSYSMHGDLKEALKQVDIFIRLINESKFIKSNTLMYYNNAANIYLQAHRYEDAEQVTDVALSIQPNFIDFLFYKAYILFVKGKYEAARLYMNQYLAVNEEFYKLEVSNIEMYTFYTKGNKDIILRLLIITSYRLKEYLSCLDQVYEIKDQNTLTNCLYEIIGAYFHTGQYCELGRFYRSIVCGNEKMAFIFKYFLQDLLFACEPKEAQLCRSMLALENMDESITESDTLNLISKYYMDGMDVESVIKILLRILPTVKKFNVQNCTELLEMMKMKIVLQCILYQTEELIKLNILSTEELLDTLKQYILIGVTLINLEQTQYLENKERIFISKMILAFASTVEYKAIEELNEAGYYYYEMRGIVTLVINAYFSKGVKEELPVVQNPITQILEMSKLKSKTAMNEPNRMKVLHGTADLTNRTVKIAEILNSKGIYTKVLNYFPNYTHTFSDYEMDITSFENNTPKLNNSIDIASRLIPVFDIYHFHSFSSLTLDHSDLDTLKEMNKKMLMHFWGQDVRLYSKAAQFNPYIKLLSKNDDKETLRQIKFFSKYIKCAIVSDYELKEYVKDYFEHVVQINLMVELKNTRAYEKSKEKLFTIIHVSTSPELFGTQYILKAINDLKDQYNINFKLIQELSYDEELLQEADLIIDQLIIGRYGQVAVDAMALGKPVVCWISDFMKEKYPKELPIIIANPDNIKEKLTTILENRELLKDLGVLGRHYVEKYHDINKEILKLINIYRSN